MLIVDQSAYRELHNAQTALHKVLDDWYYNNKNYCRWAIEREREKRVYWQLHELDYKHTRCEIQNTG